MRNGRGILYLIVRILTIVVLLGVHGNVRAATLIVPDDYPTIQSAINAASPGDTILIRSGIYFEDLTLNKSVILTAEFFDSADPTHNTTIVDGELSSLLNTLVIPSGISPIPTIRGLVIRNGGDGIHSNSEFIVEYNYLSQALGDAIDYGQGSGGINRHNDTNRRFIVTRNLIANSRFAGIGLMPNQNSTEDFSGADIVEAIRVYNNTLYGNDYGISGGDNLVAFNNIIANSTTKGVWRVQGQAESNSVVAYSLFYNNGLDADQSALGAGNLFGQNPLFASPPNPGPDGLWGTVDDDFSGLVLGAGSPSIDAGVTQYIANNGEAIPPTPITDFSGAAPDLGWKEFNLPPPGTPTATATSGSVRFAVIGDYGSASQPELDVANLVRSWNPDFVITTGDNNYSLGAAETIDVNIGQYYHEFIYPYTGSYGAGAATNRFFPSLGNHDWGTANAQPYLDYFTLPGNERYYDFVWGPVHFFAIDSDSREPDGRSSTSTQAIWLQNQLAASSAPWKLVYMHHPPYSSGANHGSTTTIQWPYQAWGASAVLAGHDHTYERIVLDGFPYFVNGLGGKSIYKFGAPVAGSQMRYNADYGAMLVETNASQIVFQFVTRTGVIIDTYTLSVAPPPTATPTTTSTDTAVPTATYTLAPSGTPTPTATDALTPTITPTTSANPPGVPSLTTPANSSLTTDYTPLFNWNDATGAPDHYQIQVATTNTFAAPVIDDSTPTTSDFTPSAALNPNTTYYWRVRAFNATGQFSPWSAVYTFRTAMAGPTLPTAHNRSQPQTLRPVFDWANVSGATSYNLQISRNDTFTNLVLNINISPSAYMPTTDLPRGVTLYWRVRANGPYGAGNWSAAGAFSSPNPPGTPSLLSPANGAQVTGLTPMLDWSDSTFAPDHYEVQISTTSNFTDFQRGRGGIVYESMYVPQAALAPSTTYYWRVRAVGAVSPLGNTQLSEWSAARSFRTPP